MRIVYLGYESGTSLHRANALRRLGHQVEIVDTQALLGATGLALKFHRETGCLFLGKAHEERLIGKITGEKGDVLWVDHGRSTTPNVLRHARSLGMKSVVLNVDDPFGKRDRWNWLLLKKALPEYDLVAVVREPNVEEAKQLGARDVIKVWRSADEVGHRRQDLTPNEEARYATDVLFLGTYMRGRGAFLKRLTDLGVPLSIVGDRWDRAPEASQLAPFWKSPGVYSDVEYCSYIQSAKICIGLLSHENRDLHTTRTMEIPSIGSLFCAERTSEHLELYIDGEEAVFWESAEECAAQCLGLLSDDKRRKAISAAGHAKCLANKTMNEPVMEQILSRLIGSADAQV